MNRHYHWIIGNSALVFGYLPNLCLSFMRVCIWVTMCFYPRWGVWIWRWKRRTLRNQPVVLTFLYSISHESRKVAVVWRNMIYRAMKQNNMNSFFEEGKLDMLVCFKQGISFNERGIARQRRPKSTLCWFKRYVVNCFSLMIKKTMQTESVSPRTWTKNLPSHRSGWDNLSSKTKTWFCSTVIGRFLRRVSIHCQKTQTLLLSYCFISQLECQPLCRQNHEAYLDNYERTESMAGAEEKWWLRNCMWLSSDIPKLKINLNYSFGFTTDTHLE